ncbi:unnamed protein product [Dovyalis caffra]|uniref:Uncharacterized protein n=1 Tax=Dovyalis caffra TaxID=77055 RepID=A0AAV1SJY0_9ROSI|nr:unnamed protein product [Dovyalis caffra]
MEIHGTKLRQVAQVFATAGWLEASEFIGEDSKWSDEQNDIKEGCLRQTLSWFVERAPMQNLAFVSWPNEQEQLLPKESTSAMRDPWELLLHPSTE